MEFHTLVEGDEQPEVRVRRSRRRALARGVAVHAVMQYVPLDVRRAEAEQEIARLAERESHAAGAADLEDEVARLALSCWLAAPVREAAGVSVWRELSLCVGVDAPGATAGEGCGTGLAPAQREGSAVGLSADDACGRSDGGEPLERAVLEGYCDLLYRTPQGYTIVDYKTDAAPREEAMLERYRLQGAAYALAVQQVTGERVCRVSFVMAGGAGPGEPAPSVEVPVTAQLLEEARQRVYTAAVTGEQVEDI